MVGASNSAGLVPVSEDESRGEAITRRRKSHGMTANALAKRAGMDPKTLKRAEDDEPGTTDTTYTRLENVLDEYDREVGVDLAKAPAPTPPPDPHLVRFKLSGNFGVDVVVEGPVENLAELQESVHRLLGQMRQPSPGED